MKDQLEKIKLIITKPNSFSTKLVTAWLLIKIYLSIWKQTEAFNRFLRGFICIFEKKITQDFKNIHKTMLTKNYTDEIIIVEGF